jgi:hypothetical protein
MLYSLRGYEAVAYEGVGPLPALLLDRGQLPPTNLTCSAVDQAALYGLLRKVRDLGLPLISVTRAQTDQIPFKGRI